MAALGACGALPALISSSLYTSSCSSSSSTTTSPASRKNVAVSAYAARTFQVLGGGKRAAWTSLLKGVALPTVLFSCSKSRVSRSSCLSARATLVQKVTAKELDDILTNNRTSPMIIDFYATWCGPCIVLAQQLEELAVEYGDDVRFLKVDTDEEHELASQMEIRGLPTMVFVSSDHEKLAIRTEGLLPTETIRNIIENEL